MTRNPSPFVVVSDQTPSLIDITAGFRLQSAALDLGTAVMVAMSAKKHGAKHPLEREKKGADPFPAHVPLGGHLEHTAALALANESVAAPEPLGAGDVAAEEAEHMFGVILPYDLTGRHVHFNDTAAGHDGVMSAVVKDQHVPLGSEGGIVLMADLAAAPLPQHFPLRPGNPHDRAQFAKTEQHIPVWACLDGVGVAPLVSELSAADDVRFRIKVLPRVPRVHGVPLRIDLQNGVSQETAQVSWPAADTKAFHEEAEVLFVFRERCCYFAADEPLDTASELRGHLFPCDDEGVSIGQAAHIVMEGRVLPSPDLFPVPVELNQDIGSASGGCDPGSWLIQRLAPHKEVASRQEIAVARLKSREMPAMGDQAGIIEQICRIPADGGDEGESAACTRIFMREPCLSKWRPAHE
jgi:hypothetical protein